MTASQARRQSSGVRGWCLGGRDRVAQNDGVPFHCRPLLLVPVRRALGRSTAASIRRSGWARGGIGVLVCWGAPGVSAASCFRGVLSGQGFRALRRRVAFCFSPQCRACP